MVFHCFYLILACLLVFLRVFACFYHIFRENSEEENLEKERKEEENSGEIDGEIHAILQKNQGKLMLEKEIYHEEYFFLIQFFL